MSAWKRRMGRTAVASWVLTVGMLGAWEAWADAVSVSLEPRGQVGKGLPSVRVHIQEPIAGFWLKLERSDGEKLSVKGGGPPGVTRTVDLRQPVGRFSYRGELEVRFPNAEQASMPLEFEAELVASLQLTLKKEDVNLAERRLVFTLNRPAKKARLKVLMDTGTTAFDGDIAFGDAPAGTPLEVRWPEAPGKVMQIELQGHDVDGFFQGQVLTPWQVDIPHQEVNFDSGKWAIRDDQKPKLDDTYRQVADAVSKYGRLAKLSLYIAGHTDTQGSQEANRTLSLNRARSIGRYLRARGLTLPIYYEGFGEEALLVATPDEASEEKNRRAEYILAIDRPVLERTPFPPQWRTLSVTRTREEP